jgi:hypothetical protein
MDTATMTEARPRAFYPDATDSAPPVPRTPGWDTRVERRLDDGRTAARMLGWFSIGLGLVEVVAPRRVTRFLDIDDRHRPVVQLMGLREIAHGAAILSQRTPVKSVWSRVGGDALDLAALGFAVSRADARTGRAAAAGAAVAGVAVLDLMTARRLGRTADGRVA